MKFLIVTHVVHGFDKNYFAYAPYVREMNIWGKYASEVIVVAPLEFCVKSAIHLDYKQKKIILKKVQSVSFQSFSDFLLTAVKLPLILWTICKQMRSADHIHLRCPGNIGLLGCICQVFFPSKPKTAKYAGNWDPNAEQPWSYKLQKWILSNTILTKNMKVLVYGEWPNQSKNIKPFFTASYCEKDKIEIFPKSLTGQIKFIFAGSLASGKRPLYAVQLLEKIIKNGWNVVLDIYGEGPEKIILEHYIAANNLRNRIVLHGSQNDMVLREAYKNAHFLILPSKSEGWPKVVAEAMFWGCLPVSTAVSCVSYMLNDGNRGHLLKMWLDEDAIGIQNYFNNPEIYSSKVQNAAEWSGYFTLDLFEKEIYTLLKNQS